MTIDREVSAALDRVAAGEPVDEVADDYGVPRVFFRVFLDVQELIEAARKHKCMITKMDGSPQAGGLYITANDDDPRLRDALKNLEES